MDDRSGPAAPGPHRKTANRSGCPVRALTTSREPEISESQHGQTGEPFFSGLLEDGFGSDPRTCAETIALASAVGLVGGSIEDATGNPANPIFSFNLSVERVAAAAEETRRHPFPLTARAENFLHGRPNLDDTIRRLQAFEEAGADVLYAPGLPSLDAIRAVCSSVKRPVNVVMGLVGQLFTVEELEGAGVKRISVGGSFARAALGGLVRAALEVKDHGTFSYAKDAMSALEAESYMAVTSR